MSAIRRPLASRSPAPARASRRAALPILFGVLALFAGCMERPETAHFGPPAVETPARVIEVFGQASVTSTPNIAEVVVSVGGFGETTDEAYRANVALTAKVTQNLLNHGVRPTDVLPRGFDLAGGLGQLDPAGPNVPGIRARRDLTVIARDLDALPKVLSAVLNFGGAVTDIRFLVANTEPLEERAREKAVIDARQRAQAFAQELGLRLGEPVGLREVPPVEVAELGDLHRGVPLEQDGHRDQYEVSATVEVIFALDPF